MKKVIALTLALSAALSLAACGSSGSSSSAAAPAAPAASSSASASDAAPAATGEDYGTYNWTAAMTVAETTTNFKMVE